MDEFDKIKELSEDIIGRKEPSFTEDNNPEDEKETVSDSPFHAEELPATDELLEKDIPTHKWHLVALSVFVGVLAISLTGFFLFGKDESQDQIITISPTPEPVRVKPKQAGGISIPDQDKLIYNRIHEATPKVEKLFPEPEKPVLPEIILKSESEPTPVVQPEIPQPQIIIEEVVPEPKKEVLTLPEKPAPKKADPVPTKVQKPTLAKAPTTNWRIQLFSTSKKATAEKAWGDILKKHKALLSDTPHDIVSAEIAGKGTFYRLQAGRFSTRDQANALCTKLKAQKQDCVPVQAGQ